MNILNFMSTGAAPGLSVDLALAAKSYGIQIRLFIRSDNELIDRIKIEFSSSEIQVISFRKTPLYALVNVLLNGRLMERKITKFLLPGAPIITPMPGLFEMSIPARLKRSHQILSIIHDPCRHKGDLLPRDFMIKHQYKKTPNLIYFSNYTKNQLQLKFGPRVLPEYVTPHPIPSLAQRGLTDQNSSRKYILLIGRNKKYQNFKACVNFWEKEFDKFPELSLIIAGQNVKHFENSKKRIFTQDGWLTEIEFGKLVAQSRALLLPYLKASQSGPASLGMGMGKFIVYTRVGGLTEQLSSYANGLPFSNSQELYKSLEIVQKSDEKSQVNGVDWRESWSGVINFAREAT
jgi:hypothetical protein